MQAAVNQGACQLLATAEHRRHLKFEKPSPPAVHRPGELHIVPLRLLGYLTGSTGSLIDDYEHELVVGWRQFRAPRTGIPDLLSHRAVLRLSRLCFAIPRCVSYFLRPAPALCRRDRGRGLC